ncbi:MAG TPA: serine hydrolase [Acidobacteriota bacterium]|nr:serine hydrolase [Acidobacteriota bacterium]
MLKRRRLSLLVGGVAFGLLVFAGALSLAPSTRTDHIATVPVSYGDWKVRDSLGVPKNKARPRMRCQAALVVDNAAGEIVYARNAYVRRPIASLTKLLTALVLLQSDADLNAVVEVTAEDARESGRSRLRQGEQMTLRDALHAALMSSDNRAARVLSRSAGMTYERFIARMNILARALGMDSTHVVEPTGLSELNIATAYDCAILVNTALDNHLIRHIATTREYTFRSLDRRKRAHRMVNTNRLLASSLKFDGAKTGYILESGWCIAGRARSADGDDITTIVLGAPTEGSRFRAMRDAFLWAFRLPKPEASQS